jgi:hypothetical protein
MFPINALLEGGYEFKKLKYKPGGSVIKIKSNLYKIKAETN